jgi:hypothetical protein
VLLINYSRLGLIDHAIFMLGISYHSMPNQALNLHVFFALNNTQYKIHISLCGSTVYLKLELFKLQRCFLFLTIHLVGLCRK